MNTTLTPMLGRELVDEELAAFHGGTCTITVGKNPYNGNLEVKASQGCQGMNITVNVTVEK